jgi:hypothetical protein
MEEVLNLRHLYDGSGGVIFTFWSDDPISVTIIVFSFFVLAQ